MTTKYVIYHDNCNDGLSAAAIHSLLEPGWEYVAGKYNKSLKDYPDFTNCEVLFLDFSFKEEDFRELLTIAKSVIVIDHHITAHHYLSKIVEEDNVFKTYFYDIDECGTSLVWQYIHNYKESIPLSIQCVKDQDIYIWTNPSVSRPVCLYMETIPRNLEGYIEYWKEMLTHTPTYSLPSHIIATGNQLLKLKKQFTNSMASHWYSSEYLGEKVLIVNCPNIFVNDISDIMTATTKYNILITYSIDEKGFYFSLRARNGSSVLPVALSISPKGGGHVGAAGAFLSHKDISSHPIKDILFPVN